MDKIAPNTQTTSTAEMCHMIVHFASKKLMVKNIRIGYNENPSIKSANPQILPTKQSAQGNQTDAILIWQNVILAFRVVNRFQK